MKFIKSHQVRVFAFGTVFLWSTAFVLTRVALTYFTVASVCILRYLTASVFLLGVAFWKKIGLPRLRDVPMFFLSGALGFAIYMITFNRGAQTLTSATGSVLIATSPIITALLARLIFREKIKALCWAAIGVSFVGILILTLWDGVFSMNTGLYWMLGAALCISGYNLCQRSFRDRYTALQSTAYSIFAGTVLLMGYFPGAAVQLAKASAYQWGVMLFLGSFPSAIAYLLWSMALAQAEKTSEVTNFMFVTPFMSAIFGFLIMREVPTLATFLGGIIIIGGLVLYQKVNNSPNGKIGADTAKVCAPLGKSSGK